LVLSIKGPNGGFYMTDKELNTSVADIVKAIDGDKLYVDCVMGLKTCSEKTPCPMHDEYKAIKAKFIKMLEHNNIATFNEKLDSGKFYLKNTN
jgi:DNA-binding IscR family transcriptional regulator